MRKCLLFTTLILTSIAFFGRNPSNPPGPFEVNLKKSLRLNPPDYRSFQKDTRYLQEIVLPSFSGPDIAVSFQWIPTGPVTVRLVMSARNIWWAGQTRLGNLIGQQVIPAVPCSSCATLIKDDAAVKALDVVWAQLRTLTYYEGLGFDGTTRRYETYDSSGLLRRLEVSQPEKPYQGSDFANIINVLVNRVLARCLPKLRKQLKDSSEAPSYKLAPISRIPEATDSSFQARLSKATTKARRDEDAVKTYRPKLRKLSAAKGSSEIVSIPLLIFIHRPSDKTFRGEPAEQGLRGRAHMAKGSPEGE